jgi:hypothetical protein
MTNIPFPVPAPYTWTTGNDSEGGLRYAVLWHGTAPKFTLERAGGFWVLSESDGTPIRDGIPDARLESTVLAYIGLPAMPRSAFLTALCRATVVLKDLRAAPEAGGDAHFVSAANEMAQIALDAYVAGFEAGRSRGRVEEVEAVVRWLQAAPGERLWRQEPMDAAAAAIARGEHLKPAVPDPDATADRAQVAALGRQTP